MSFHAAPQRFNPFTTEDSENHHEGMEEVSEIPSEIFNFHILRVCFIVSIPSPRHWVRIEVLTGVEISKDLHPQHGEDVDEDDEDEGEVGLAAQGGDDDGEEDPHGAP